jgi:hypothetical protein
MADEYEFDVALSFAGEDREYVTEVAHALGEARIAYFLDSEYLSETWGAELTEYFDGVYRKRARYAILFISKHYAESEWARAERRSALARALTERGAYVLPVRLDGTEIHGLRPTVGYLDSRRTGIDGLVQELIKKLSGGSGGPHGWPGDRGPRGEREIAAVLAERPPCWEYLAFSGLLLNERDQVEDKYRDHQLRYAEPTGESVPDDSFFEWASARMDEITQTIAAIEPLFSPEVQERAFGAPGISGEPTAIRHLAGRWNALYRRLLDWAARMRGTVVSEQYRPIRNVVADLINAPIEQYREFVDGFVREVDTIPAWVDSGSSEPRQISLVLTLSIDPSALEASDREMARLRELFGLDTDE